MRTYETSLEPTPPPWALRGTGYIILYAFKREERRAAAFTQPNLEAAWRGGPGALVWMDYTASPVGPYREILFIPGLFAINERLSFSISRIFVETLDSVVGGRANWGIPKDLATFSGETRADGTERLQAHIDERPLADLYVHPLGPVITLDTAFMPITIMQRMHDRFFYTPLVLKAGVQWLDVIRAWTDETDAELPALAGHRPLAAVKLHDFDVTFPMPRIEVDAEAAASRLSTIP